MRSVDGAGRECLHHSSVVVVTLGAERTALVGREGVLQYPPWPMSVPDTIAAGNAFADTSAASLAASAPLEEAALSGHAAGAVAVTEARAYDALLAVEATGSLAASRRA